MVNQFQKNVVIWTHGPFPELDGEKIENDVNLWYKLIQKLQRTFKTLPAPTAAINDMKKKVNVNYFYLLTKFDSLMNLKYICLWLPIYDSLVCVRDIGQIYRITLDTLSAPLWT